MWRRVFPALLVLLTVFIPFPISGSVSIEFTLVTVRVSPQLYGTPSSLPIPFNTSWYPSETNIYVLAENAPSYYHVFSILPPLVLVFEPSLSPERTYRVFVSTSNPYASFALPYSSAVFAAYDDFDIDSGMWVKMGGVRISGGIASLSPRSAMTLNASTNQLLGVFVSSRGGRGLRIELPVTGSNIIVLTDSNFTDWQSIMDGNDIFFVNERAEPQYYSLIYFNKDQKILIAWVNATSNTVFMVYGGANKYPQYRLFNW